MESTSMPRQDLDFDLLGQISEKLVSGFDASQSLMGLYDGDDMLRYANQAFRDAFLRQDLPSADFESILRNNHGTSTGVFIRDQTIDAYIAHAQARRRTQAYRTLPLDLQDGRRFLWTETLLDEGWLLCNAVDVTMMKEVEASLRNSRDIALEASQTDFLTRLPNQRQCEAFLKRSLSSSHGRGCELTVAMIDLDYFKTVNDRFGHSAGDMALCRFADVLRASLRSSDMVARVGGEEFMIIWPDAPLTQALESLQRLRNHPVVIELPIYATQFSITFSAGVVQAKADDTVRSLVSRADKKLYKAKARGRNAIEVAAPSGTNTSSV